MSANLDLVRSIYADWERGDFSRSAWADPDIEFVLADGPEPGQWRGVAAMAKAWSERLSPFVDYQTTGREYRPLDDERILVLVGHTGRGRSSGLELADLGQPGQPAALFHVRDGRVTRLVVYTSHDRALADLGLEAKAMPEKSTTRDPEELARRWHDAFSRRDVEALMTLFAPDAVWEAAGVGDERLRGLTAIRGMLEDWLRPYEQYEADVEELVDLGNGVVFEVAVSKGRPINSSAFVQWRQGFVVLIDGDLIGHVTSYTDIDQARAAAERLAEERR